jgi:SAM-dependent methyltransferase
LQPQQVNEVLRNPEIAKEDHAMPDDLDQAAFAAMYAHHAPWDIGEPQAHFVSVAHRISGSILDAGCGTGDTALFLAGQGRQVTGIDFLDEPIQRAKQKAVERGLSVTFFVRDALFLKDWDERFDNVIDSGLFHVFGAPDRKRYVEGLATVLKPGGFLFLVCWSDAEPGTEGPQRVSRKDLHEAFDDGWAIESIQPCEIETRPTRPEFRNAPYRPKAWFVVAQRKA